MFSIFSFLSEEIVGRLNVACKKKKQAEAEFYLNFSLPLCLPTSPNTLSLSPPLRTNSDSALHTSVMNPPTGDPFTTGGPTLTPQSNRRTGEATLPTESH